MIRTMFCVIVVAVAVSACATRQNVLSRISLDMTKEQVIQNAGEPQVVRGAIRTRSGEVVEVWEYELYQYAGAMRGVSPYYRTYWLYFVDGTLFQWGEAGDWAREADRIYELRFR